MNNPTSAPCSCLSLSQALSHTLSRLALHRLTAATGAAGLHALALADLHGGLVVDGGVAHALLDLAGHGEESLLDVAGVLGGGLEEGDSEAVCELL